MKISWNGFSKKSYHERLELLRAQALLSPEKQTSLEQDEQVSLAVADQLSENVVGTFSPVSYTHLTLPTIYSV